MRCVMAMWLNSLGLKVLLAFVVGVALSIVLLLMTSALVVDWRSDILSGYETMERTKELARKLVFDHHGRPVGLRREVDEVSWVFDSLKQETAYRVLDADGQVVLTSAEPDLFLSSPEATLSRTRGRFDFERDGVLMHGATEPVEHDGQVWFFQFATSVRLLDIIQRGFAVPFMSTGITVFSLVLFFVFGACAYVTLTYTLKPLRRLSAGAAAISPRSLHARLQLHAVPTEIAPLVESFNRVLDRLEQGYRTQQAFLASAAHELKTPLALIRAQIELMEGGEDRRALLNDVQHMTRQVQQLLQLAETSERYNYHFTEVDVAEVAREAVAYLQRMADSGAVSLQAPGHSVSVPWLADRSALFTLLKNLLENAIQHAPPGTSVMVAVGANALAVRDQGPGVSEVDRARMFTRFWRSAARRDHGAGLGLAICQEIAQAHGWTLSVHPAEPGLLLQVRRGDAASML
ncbi:histidine kinase, Classic [Isoalcanivorax pacificus W11-5]|uniref:histidine kinase n=2 Tax=Isoalcanivorax TaxID=3020833 RepID=A0A0B4XQK2_9GAMM|nr:histidine kinase, Classic [Isoalcanivorax pacificus W11-5]